MIYKYILLFLSLSILSMASCKKDLPKNKAEVKGIIRDATTAQPLASAKIFVVDDNGSFGMGGGFKPVKKFESDANGAYSFSFESEGGSYYLIPGDYPNYRQFTENYKYGINMGERNKINIDLTPKAWLQLHVKNANPVNEEDTIRFYLEGFHELVGTTIDTVFSIYEVDGNRHWERGDAAVIKSGKLKIYSNTVFCKAFDTTHYEINY